MTALGYEVETPSVEQPQLISGVITGDLVGFANEGRTPLVTYAERQGSAAVPARSVVDLHGDHIGRQVLLAFDRGDSRYPIVLGWVRQEDAWPLAARHSQVDVDADGQRLLITAKDRLVLRCGKASITLTKAGKVLIEGAYVLTRSSGVNRIKGGSVQLN